MSLAKCSDGSDCGIGGYCRNCPLEKRVEKHIEQRLETPAKQQRDSDRIFSEIMTGNFPTWAVSGTEARVCEDIAGRQEVGLNKYGVSVEGNPLSLRQWLQHAYEEALDQAVYLKRAIEEIEENAEVTSSPKTES